MSASLIKLESFTGLPGAGGSSSYTRDDLDLAFADGLAQGRAQRQDEDLQGVCSGMKHLADALSADEARRQELRADAVASLAPILSEMLDALVPSAQSQRMERSLVEELHRLSAQATPLHCRIACRPDLRAMVVRCLDEAGISGIELDDQPGTCVSLSLEGGRIEFVPERVAENIRALIAEITEGEEKWTH